MPDLKHIYAKEIFPNEKLKKYFLKCRSKEKVLYSFTSDNEIIDEEKKYDNQLETSKYEDLYSDALTRLVNLLYLLYLFFVIFSKDVFYILLEKKYDTLSDYLILLLIFIYCVEMMINFLTRRTYTCYFMFFEVISLISLFSDLFVFEYYLFDLFDFYVKRINGISDVGSEEVVYLIHLVKALRVTKIYRLIICFVERHTREKYKHRNEWNFEKMESMQNRTNLKESLKFTNKMHLALIKRYFMSMFFVMLSFIFIETMSIPKVQNNSMEYFIYNLDLISLEDYYESEFLKALYFYTEIQKEKGAHEYIVSFKSKRKLQNFINKKEINVGTQKWTLWDFSHLSHKELLKFISMNPPNGRDDEEEVILSGTLKDLNSLRRYETKVYQSAEFTFYINVKENVKKRIKNVVLLKILVIVFSFIILFYFTSELNLLLFPIESILKKLKLMKSNPTLALEMQEELLNHELDNILRNTNLKRKGIKQNYEILKMEENLMKLGTLMLLGFGEAGAKIISKNINAQERVNLLVNGEVVYSVFSFCDIRNFTEITEVLKEKIMIFINLVAEIIHDCCDFYGGSINKNIGDAFLLVWKCKKRDFHNEKISMLTSRCHMRGEGNGGEVSDKACINRVCDLAFLSTVKTLIRLHESEKIRSFLKSEKIHELFGKSIIELSFGLHFGWAIEGAIGSSYKIDLSYLSENVNIASRLQDISKTYKRNVVISGEFYENLSDGFKKFLRRIDRVTLKGCGNPLDLYTFDIRLDKIPKKKNIEVFDVARNVDIKMIKILNDIKQKTERRRRKKEVFNLAYDLYEEYSKSADIKSIQMNYPEEYLRLFENALELYLGGQWQESHRLLKHLKGNSSYEDDILCQLEEFLRSSNSTAPSDWGGFRRFLQKS
ncbi:adenylyl cyclase alpha, putative [Plasmodium knowlesi strain H]|uniref:Adenylyl cyclase alpha, putative n=2 Tax=Plasmodium knowlesi TaxID=5850 RepID=A0A679L4B9_PLAKH|nr:adenylyl cyclase alpha, putative [Plasmodium knowlesi strain H]OTN67880.1 putative Adenylyl cyclase 1 [Plasmodium knowlesi]CAA9990561.1 adenylyl cyclase alpha, putative [Plasmodium knowlesi strain H]VVS80035.1 adenylyl cyclase alpha, putative [Plasmodium knowlesi strain H]